MILTGPTGVGKTELSLDLAQELKSPIINADSRQIYRELPIGTAAPTAEEQKLVQHYFVGSKSVADEYSAGDYEREAITLIYNLFRDKDILLMCGGGMMYIDAVCNGLDALPKVPKEIRQEVLRHYEADGIEWLRAKLEVLDSDYFKRVDLCNPQRMIHAIEVSLTAGLPYSELLTGKRKKREFDIIKVVLNRERSELYNRIDSRVIKMLERGLEEEARSVMQYRHLNSLNTVGYKEMFSYFDGKIDKQECVRLIQQNSRHYAKRQLTWFRRDNETRWLDISKYNKDDILSLL